MEGVVALLAVIGGLAVVSWAIRSVVSSARILKSANQFQAATLEAVNAIETDDELRQIRAIGAWEEARRVNRSLSLQEQRIAVETLRDRRFPMGVYVGMIEAFIQAKSSEHHPIDEELAAVAREA